MLFYERYSMLRYANLRFCTHLYATLCYSTLIVNFNKTLRFYTVRVQFDVFL
jgi:hypothetical protein